jgi:hypothetical protein
MSEEEVRAAATPLARIGYDASGATVDEIRQVLVQIGELFRDEAPMTAAEAARVILDGVRAEQWRILVGADAHVLDRLVRETPEEAYEVAFMERFQAESGWKLGV